MANSDGFAPISPADTTVGSKGFDELREEMDRNVNEFLATAVKMKIGDRNAGFDNDIKRIEAARQQVGPDITLMVDANCALTIEASDGVSSCTESKRYFLV